MSYVNIPSAAAAGQLAGTGTNDNASAGNVGEFISSTVASGAPVALTSTVSANVTSIILTAGDWDVSFSSYFLIAGTTSVANLNASISLTNATLDTVAGNYAVTSYASPGATFGGLVNNELFAGVRRLSLAAPTTVFAVANAQFSTSTVSAWGILRARRVR
jgi:hypothetical protein